MGTGSLILAAATLAQANVAPGCGTVIGEDIKLFDGVAIEQAAPAVLRLDRRARATQSFSLLSAEKRLPAGPLSTHRGKPVEVRFHRTLSPDGQGERWCTGQAVDGMVGANDPDGDFFLRCLIDADGDGRFEAYQAQARLVPVNARRPATPQPPPPVRSFAAPVALETAENAPGTRSPAFAPRVFAQLRVTRLTETEAVIERRLQPGLFPNEPFRSWADAERWTVPLREGTWTSPDGTRILLARQGSQWSASAPAGWFPTPTLACNGAHVILPNSMAIIGFGGLGVYARPGAD